MNCEKYLKLIDDLIEDELDDQTADQVSLHLFDCPSCTSQFELLEREKRIYSHYLFEVEPPSDLSAKFQSKLEALPQSTILAAADGFISKIFAFLRFNPALITAVALILLAVSFSLMSLVKEPQTFEKAAVSQKFEGFQLMLPPIKKEVAVVPVEPNKSDEIIKNERNTTESSPKPIAVKQIVRKAEPNQNLVAKTPQSSEEEQQLKELQALEIETAKQLEKVELLLRSFRNARFVEGSELYDISYEKQQARKLLQNNFALRQRAETYGSPFAEEMLSKIEPYLLDIANLNLNPAPEQVLEIKERVKNQNIIASLQGF